MIHRHENPPVLMAGALSLLVHTLFFLLLFVNLKWQNVQPSAVAVVELWDALPTPPMVAKPQPALPKPVVQPKPESPPLPEPKAEIVIKKPKPKPPAKPEEAKPKPDSKQKAAEEAKLRQEALARLQQQLEEEARAALQDSQQREAKRLAKLRAEGAAAQLERALDGYLGQIAEKIRQYVNPQVCGEGNPELQFKIALMPTGELLAHPRLERSSGIAACDAAVERAILQAQPLPLPSDPDLIARLRDLHLKFKPKG